MRTSFCLGRLWLRAPPLRHLCLLLLCLTGSMHSLVGVLACSFGCTGAGDEVRFQNCSRSAIHCHVAAKFSRTSWCPTCTHCLGRSTLVAGAWCCVDHGVVPKHLKASDYLIHRPQSIFDLSGVSGYITTALGQHFLLLSPSFL